MISIVVPTYQEAANLPLLAKAIDEALADVADMPAARRLSPIGYKIALEIFVKGDFNDPSEVPIQFSDRQHGESKLSLKEQLNFLRHLGRLYAYKLRFGVGT